MGSDRDGFALEAFVVSTLQIIALCLSVALAVYLLIALLRPEKFQ